MVALRSTQVISHITPYHAETLAHMAEAFGAVRPAAVARVMTKRFKEVRRDMYRQALGMLGQKD